MTGTDGGQQDSYAEELGGLLERLEEADRWLTPEHVTHRFRELGCSESRPVKAGEAGEHG